MNTDKQKLFNFLKSQRLISLATCTDKPWISTVYYAVDKSFNLYFISEPETRHAHDIKKNDHVACSIADTHQKVTDKKIGVQISGRAQLVEEEKLIVSILAMWNAANTGFEKIINLENMKKKVIKAKVFQITPEYIKFFNEELFGPEGFEEYNFKRIT